MLVDANILLYAVDETSPFHPAARDWLSGALNGCRRVGLPWMSLVAFVRISTHPRASLHPLQPAEATAFVDDWLAAGTAWIPHPGSAHAALFASLVEQGGLTGNLVTDAHLAAIAFEHGLEVVSADSDFARFTGLRWSNPVATG